AWRATEPSACAAGRQSEAPPPFPPAPTGPSSFPTPLSSSRAQEMSLRSAIRGIGAQEDLNFLLTNRIPRLAFTRFMGWFSKIENPVVASTSIALWRFFCDVDLTDSGQRQFRSLNDAFTRKLRPGARKVDPDEDVLVSPCDAIVGAFGRVTQ